ncbi:MAG: threonine ammonia-lyase [Firmicutes bacterium]|nr:threonine ammonia-lyase [Candidatus Colivicinus equi]
MDIELSEIEAARRRLKGVINDTMLVKSYTFSKMADANIYLKYENLQKTGSFKIRGASNKIAKMIEQGDRSDVIASSAGNHAQGVACAASKFNLKATIVMPKHAPVAKVHATRGYGAEVVLYGSCYDEAHEKAIEIQKERGSKFLHPYDDLDVIAGQGTLGIELLEQLPAADIVLIPAGGGGLLAGVATAIKKINPRVKVYGVQGEHADAIVQSFEHKQKICTSKASTIADGIEVNIPGDTTLELIYKYVDGMIRVSDDDIADAILLLLERCKQVVEPAGAASVAAIIGNQIDVKGKNVICLLSGGNIDVSTMDSMIKRGMTVRHRYMEIIGLIDDTSQAILDFIKVVSDAGARILNFRTDKHSTLLSAGQVRITVDCEIGDEDDKKNLYKALENSYDFFTTDEENDGLYLEKLVEYRQEHGLD